MIRRRRFPDLRRAATRRSVEIGVVPVVEVREASEGDPMIEAEKQTYEHILDEATKPSPSSP